MKNILIVIVLAHLVVSTTAQFNGDKEPFITRSLSNDAIKSVKAKTSGGNITVTSVSAGEARLEVYVRPGNSGLSWSKEEIQKKLDEDYEFIISVANNQLTATAKPKRSITNWNKAVSVSYKIYVPQAVSTELHTSGGNIALHHLTGDQDFHTSGGNLDMDGLSGNIVGKTSGGNINVKNTNNKIQLKTSGGSIKAVNCSGDITLATSGGNLALEQLKGTINAKTSGGSVHGSDINGDLAAHTSGGNITLNNLSGSLETSTSGGNIKANMKQLGKYVTIKNSGGNVDLEIPQNQGVSVDLHASNIRMVTPVAFKGTQDKNEMNGTFNGGGIPVTVRSSSGSLSIALK
jgi:DUF4097 and DUF4098 domain-containing protein YvlB